MKFLNLILPYILALIIIVSCSVQSENSNNFDPNRLLSYSVEKIRLSMVELDDSNRYPRNIEKGETKWSAKGIHDWTSGFWPGILWYAYEASGDENIKKQAMKFTIPLEIIANTSARNHDIGFQIYCSFGNGYRLTGNEKYKTILLEAADTLATLFNPDVGSILSWPNKQEFKHNTIVDNMMNLEILYWASQNGSGKRLYDIAESHAEVTMQNLVRKEGSLFHVGSFDAETGEFIKAFTHQGYSDSSMWARGQAWGIYGFTISARETGRKDFLETTIKLANHFLDRLPEDGIPYWDFDDPKIPNSPKDASAAAIAACGMLELSELIDDKDQKEFYRNSAFKLINILSSEKYLSRDSNQAFLLHSTGHYPKNSEIDISIIYADYYYLEALLRITKLNNKI